MIPLPPILIWSARLILAGLFLFSGLIKAASGPQFAVTIAQFTILSPAFIGIAATLLPFVEILAAILLLIPRTARLGADAIAALLLIFTGAITWALSQGLIVDCGCFGESTPSQTKMFLALGRDLVLLVLTLGLARRPLPRSSPPCRSGTDRKIPTSGAPR